MSCANAADRQWDGGRQRAFSPNPNIPGARIVRLEDVSARGRHDDFERKRHRLTVDDPSLCTGAAGLIGVEWLWFAPVGTLSQQPRAVDL